MSYHEGSNWQANKEDAGKPIYENTSKDIEDLKDHVASQDSIIEGYKEQIKLLEQKQYGLYQLCPKCNGQKKLSCPPDLPTGVQLFSSSQTEWPCDICKGEGILIRPEIINTQPKEDA